MVSSVPIGHHITMEVEEGVEGSGARLLRAKNEEGWEPRTVVTLWPDVCMSTVSAGGLCVHVHIVQVDEHTIYGNTLPDKISSNSV